MSDFLEDAERAALRDVAHLLPAKWQQMIDVVAASVPATPPDTVAAPTDPAAARLEQIEHIVVVMLENRSFDHMLGYLSLPPAEGGKGRSNIDGLTGPAVNINTYNGTSYPIHHLAKTALGGEAEDPDHSGASVDEQLANGGQGVVRNLARPPQPDGPRGGPGERPRPRRRVYRGAALQWRRGVRDELRRDLQGASRSAQS